MPGENLSERLRRSGMEEYLLEGEEVLIVQRPHWAKIIKPVAPAIAGLIVVFALDTSMPTNAGGVVNLLWAGWLILVARAAFNVILWRRNWFVATDKRLLVNYGLKLVNVNLAMLSLSKVVDLSYTRSTMGFLLGYGTLVRESSGSGQTLHDVEWVKDPDETYRAICAAVFNLADVPLSVDEQVRGNDGQGDRFEDGPPLHTPGRYVDYVSDQKRTGPINFRRELDKRPNPIPGIRIQYGEATKKSGRPWSRNPELNDSVRHDATTGRTRYRRSPTEDDWVPTSTDDDDLGDQDVDQSDDQGDDGDDGQN
jgi:hypothetical protein